jgi:8-oxo-dGTP diphosphatase
MDEASRPKVGVGVMILKDGKALISQRMASHGKGEFQFVGGHLEHLESFEECARRETFEETGLEIANIRFQYLANTTHFALKHYVHVALTADWHSGEPQHLEPEKNGPWQWYALEDLPEPLLLFSQLHVRSMREGVSYFDDVA